jgi:hypothetical protein
LPYLGDEHRTQEPDRFVAEHALGQKIAGIVSGQDASFGLLARPGFRSRRITLSTRSGAF